MKKKFLMIAVVVLIAAMITATVSAAGLPDAGFELSTGFGGAGELVKVEISLVDNPGLISAKLKLTYDSALTLVSVENTGVLGGDLITSEHVEDSPYILYWDDSLATENNTNNGVVAVLTFKISDTAAPGSYCVWMTFEQDDIFDKDLNNVPIHTTSGTVVCEEYELLAGDATHDGAEDSADLAVLVGSISGTESISAVAAKKNADVNSDGVIDGTDLILLTKYVAGVTTELK